MIPTETQTPEVSKTALPVEKPDWKAKIAACRKDREIRNRVWKTNVDFRKNQTLSAEPESDTISVPVDWSRTKDKTAQLFFQVPEIKLRGRTPQSVGTAAAVAQILNFELQHEIKAYITMDEALQDAINASGFAAVMVGYDATFETVMMPHPDTAMMPPDQVAMQYPMGVPEVPQQRVAYQCYYARRISPGMFLYPTEFTSSDWQTASWLGEEGRVPLAQALRDQWIDETYETDCRDKIETVNSETNERGDKLEGKWVKYSRIFYRRADVDAECKDPRQIYHLLLVEGKDDPVFDEPLKWQKYDPQTRTWMGIKGFPIKVGTLTTISDEAIPPSDSEIGRPQVKELIKFRSQMVKQRDLSLPMRWYDVNYLDEDVVLQINSGKIQDMIPVNGPGGNVIGEVARANYPRENYESQNVIQRDLDQAWSMGPNQQGYETPGDTSAAEAKIIAESSNVRISYEQAKVLRFFLEIAEAVLGLMQMFQDETKYAPIIGDDGVQALQPWSKGAIAGDFLFEAKPDAAVKVDVGQKRVEMLNLYNKLRHDPLVNPQELVRAIVETHGLDASKMVVQPQPEKPKPAAMRFSYTGEDLANPMVVALVQKNSPEPLTPEDIAAAKQLMADVGIPELPASVMPLPEPGEGGQPPSPEQLAAASEHDGPPKEADSIDRRYSMGNEGPEA